MMEQRRIAEPSDRDRRDNADQGRRQVCNHRRTCDSEDLRGRNPGYGNQRTWPASDLSPARRAEHPRQQPDRYHDHGAEQEVAPQPVDGVKAEIPEPLKQQPDAVEDIPGIEADRGEHHAHQNRQQDQPKRHRERRAAEKAVQAVIGCRQFPGVVGQRWSPARESAAYCSESRADGEPACGLQWPPAAVTGGIVSAFSIRSSVSSRSASRGGLSQRSRLMRGNRIATPDLCRGERCKPSKATSSTSPWSGSCTTCRTGPNFSVVLRRTKRSICSSSSSVKPKYALPTGTNCSPSSPVVQTPN